MLIDKDNSLTTVNYSNPHYALNPCKPLLPSYLLWNNTLSLEVSPHSYGGNRIWIGNIANKWKNHFYEMKGDVGMSLHEKERNKKMPTPRNNNPIPTSLFCFNMLFVCLFVMNALGKANSKTS